MVGGGGGEARKMLGMAGRERNKVNCVTSRRVGFISGCNIGSRDILNLLLVGVNSNRVPWL